MQLRSDSENPWHVLLSNRPGYTGISIGSGSTWATIKTGELVSTGVWHHVAVTYGGVAPGEIASFQIFLDAVPQALTAAGAFSSQPQESRIGGTVGANHWRGMIRDVRIYNHVLSPAEITALHAAP
jgi:hypothetical protein